MAKHKADIKHLRATERRTARNRAAVSALRTAIKRVRTATKKADAEKALANASSVIDKSAKAGLIHKNNASNKKSRLAKFVGALAQ